MNQTLENNHIIQKLNPFKALAVSFTVHLLIVYLLLKFVTTKTEYQSNDLEINVKDVEIREIQEISSEEIEETPDDALDEEFVDDIEVPQKEDNFEMELNKIESEIPSTLSDSINDFEPIDVDILPQLFSRSNLYSTRTNKNKSGMLKKYGGQKESQTALLKALEWLKRVQSENGSWADKPAHTALALLCFLAHGESTASEEFGFTVQIAMHFLVSSMPSDGSSCGNSPYTHAIVTYALAEAYGMTSIPFILPAMNDGIRVIIDEQQKDGGFDYKYKKGKRWDLSIAGWQIQALKAGFAAGADVPNLVEALDKSVSFVKKTYKNGKFGYSSPGTGGNMTGVGALCLQLLGEGKSREVKGACETISSKRLEKLREGLGKSDWSKAAAKNLYGWYYETQAMFHKSGSDWHKWNRLFQKVLITNQHDDGHWEVGKAPYGFKNDLSGKVYCTTLCCLQLEVYYRYLPTYKVIKGNFIKTAKIDITEDDDVGLIIE